MAAGLGFKDFTTGEVLTAADVDGYLMQGIWVFASASARNSAVTSPQEGNFAFLKDTNSTTYYDGSAWTSLGGGGGKLLQVVQATTTAFFSTNSTSLVDITGMSVSITPTANTSKVLAFINTPTLYRGGSSGSLTIRLVRGSTTIWNNASWGVGLNSTNAFAIDYCNFYLDSPATTSATTYKVQMSNASSDTSYWNYNGSATEVASITLFEIGA